MSGPSERSSCKRSHRRSACVGTGGFRHYSGLVEGADKRAIGWVFWVGLRTECASGFQRSDDAGNVVASSHRGWPGAAQPIPCRNPDLTSKITQISRTASVANQQIRWLQTELRKRYNSGLEYPLAYTWSHGMSDAIGYYGEGGQADSQSAYWQNLYNQRVEWGSTYFDTKHMFTGSFFYELPFGRGQAHGGSWNRACRISARSRY